MLKSFFSFYNEDVECVAFPTVLMMSAQQVETAVTMIFVGLDTVQQYIVFDLVEPFD